MSNQLIMSRNPKPRSRQVTRYLSHSRISPSGSTTTKSTVWKPGSRYPRTRICTDANRPSSTSSKRRRGRPSRPQHHHHGPQSRHNDARSRPTCSIRLKKCSRTGSSNRSGVRDSSRRHGWRRTGRARTRCCGCANDGSNAIWPDRRS